MEKGKPMLGSLLAQETGDRVNSRQEPDGEEERERRERERTLFPDEETDDDGRKRNLQALIVTWSSPLFFPFLERDHRKRVETDSN